MATLGDAFSPEERRKSVLRRLQPGVVIYLDVVFPEGTRSKYLAIAHVDDQCCTLVVNSEVHPFIERRPELAMQNATRFCSTTRTSLATRSCGFLPKR